MTLTKFVNATVADATEVNANFNTALTLAGLNTIRGLIDRSGVWGLGMMDIWGDAYVDADGREDSVSVTNTIAKFSTNKYISIVDDLGINDTLNDPNSFKNPSNAIDASTATAATYTIASTGTEYLGITFDEVSVTDVIIKASMGLSVNGDGTITMYLEKYDGSTWSNIAQLAQWFGGDNTLNYDSIYALNQTVQGLRIKFTSTGGAPTNSHTDSLYMLHYDIIGDATIEHTIPTGTYSPTISSAIGIPMISDWETGSDIQYKLTNATEDTGWLNCGNIPEISIFTAFTSEPTKLIVKLIPKTTSPTDGYPSIKGFVVNAE